MSFTSDEMETMLSKEVNACLEKIDFLNETQVTKIKNKLISIGVDNNEDLKYLELKDLVDCDLNVIQCRKVYQIFLDHHNRWTEELDSLYSADISTGTSSFSESPCPNSPASNSATSSKSTSSSTSCNDWSPWSYTFIIPWQKFPQNFIDSCEVSNCPSPSDRKQVVRILVDEIQAICKRPSIKDVQAVCLKLIDRYKISLSDNFSGSIIGSGVSSWVNQINERIHNKNRKKVSSDSESGVNSKKKRSSYGCLDSWNRSPELTEIDELHTKKEWLKDEYVKTVKNTQQIDQHMKDVFPLLREQINKNCSSISELKTEWPFLFEKQCCLEHFRTLTGVSIEEQFLEYSKNKKRVLLTYMSNQENPDVKEVIADIDKYKSITTTKYPETDGIIPLLLKHFNEEGLIEYYPLATDTKKIEEQRRKTGAPVISVVENRSVTVLHTFDDAVMVMFALHYILNLEYLTTCIATLEFLQRAYMGINPLKGSKNKKKQGKAYQVHPKVLQLVNELKIFKKRCKCLVVTIVSS